MAIARANIAGIGIVILAIFSSVSAQQVPAIGVDCNYAMDMAAHHKTWTDQHQSVDLFALLARRGCDAARIRLWVGDDGMNRLNYATDTAMRAQQAGLKPCLALFLSDDWADFVKQPAPAIWKDLPPRKKAEAVEAYAQNVVHHMAEAGVRIDTFEIGNEIDFGICGEFEEQWPHRVDIDYMRQRIWPRMIPILNAAEAGVLKANPDAKFILHLSQWNNSDYCIAFWQTMLSAGVRIDYAGLSYYPSSSDKSQERTFSYLQKQIAKIAAAIKKPVIICETGYPSAEKFGGQFSTWNHPADGYPLTDAGQARWLADLLAMAGDDLDIAGVYYWSPEWYGGGLWDAFALFDSHGNARPGLMSFQVRPTTRRSAP